MDEQFRLTLFGSNRQQIFFKISIFKNFAIFTEKDLCWNLFSTKLQVRRPSTWLKRAKSKMRTQNLRLRIQDPRPGPQHPWPRTRDPRTRESGFRNPELGIQGTGPGTPGPRTQDPKTWNPGTLNIFTELWNKTLKSKKSITSKRDKAKHPFTYFLLSRILLELRFASEIFRKILGTVDCCLSNLSTISHKIFETNSNFHVK